MKTKLFPVVLCVLWLLMPVASLARTFKYNYKGINFVCKQESDQVSIVAFDRKAARVVIPATVVNAKGASLPVSTVDFYDEVMSYQTAELAIEKGITEIKPYCFRRFVNLNLVYIPSTIEKIGQKAFNAKHLPTFKMPSSIKEEDLKKGLAIYPKQQSIGNFKEMDFSEYDEDFAQETSVNKPEETTKSSKAIAAGTSDVDYNIPTTSTRRENTFCIIIANEKYHKAPQVDFAAIDGATFKRYCVSTLGIPEQNIRLTTNANYLTMQEQFDWLKMVADEYGDEANFIVYYAGHGVPNDEGSCYLLPVDGNPKQSSNGYSLKKLYEMLGSLTSQSALVLIDACFSGNDRNDMSMLGSDRGIVRKIQEETVGGHVVVMSAASNTETALPFEEKGHGMFTYFLLKKMQETKGKVKYGELYDYVRKQVSRNTIVTRSKKQTPSVTFSSKISSEWRNMSF